MILSLIALSPLLFGVLFSSGSIATQPVKGVTNSVTAKNAGLLEDLETAANGYGNAWGNYNSNNGIPGRRLGWNQQQRPYLNSGVCPGSYPGSPAPAYRRNYTTYAQLPQSGPGRNQTYNRGYGWNGNYGNYPYYPRPTGSTARPPQNPDRISIIINGGRRVQ